MEEEEEEGSVTTRDHAEIGEGFNKHFLNKISRFP